MKLSLRQLAFFIIVLIKQKRKPQTRHVWSSLITSLLKGAVKVIYNYRDFR